MSAKRKIRTLRAKQGKVWMDDEFFGVLSNLPFRSPRIAASEGWQEIDNLSRDEITLPRRMLAARRGLGARSYEKPEDVRELGKRIEALEKRLDKAIPSVGLGDITVAVGFLISEVENLEVIRKVSYRHEERNLDFILVVDQLSDNILEEISKIEIVLSRKFPNLSIDIEPILCDEEVPEESYVMFVRK